MKRAALAIVGTIASLVLLLSFKAHTQAAPTTPPAAISSTGTTASGGGSGHGGGAGSSSSGHKPSGGNASSGNSSKTYTGSTVMTRYGPVQVQITVTNGRLSDVTAVTYPTSNPRDAQINGYAIPALNSEASSAGSANIHMVSGATYTSQGYISSLQSALDQAGL